MEGSRKTPVDMLEHWAAERPERVYLRQPRQGRYQDFTWSEVRRLAGRIAGALRALGLAPGDRVGLLSENCAEWFVIDLALMIGGYVSVPVYATASGRTIRYVLEHSGAKAVFVGKLSHLTDQESGLVAGTPRLGLPYDTLPVQHDWQELLRMGAPLADYVPPDPERIATIVYTSGSTGRPKGVVQAFSSISWGGDTVRRDLGGTDQDRVVSYLPLAHITERVYIEMASFYTGGIVSFVESRETFVDDVKRARPTMFVAVPRLWTLFRENILEKVGARRLELSLKIPLIRGMLQRKIRDGLGLTDARTLGSGSAPIAPSLIDWYHRVGLNITEAWGMTENCAYATLNYPFRADKIGSVGRPGIDCEVKAGDDGELLFRGPGLMKEYYRDPEATAAAFTEDGFFRTGDRCRIDDDGYVYITGRVGDTFKTAKGKFVVPVPLESRLEENVHVLHSCVIGRGMPQPVALVQPSSSAAGASRDDVRASLEATIGAINAGVESHERLDAIVVVDEPWTTDSGVLTPTLKIKRHVLEERFAARIAGIRGGRVLFEDEL